MLRIDGPAWIDPVLTQHWPPTGLVRIDSTDGAPDLVVHVDGDAELPDEVRLTGNEEDLGTGWTRVESVLGLFAAEHLRGRVAIHAGVVRWRDRLLILPGPSFAGKSTLCLALAEAGADVLSDEYALVTPATGEAVGWHRPIHRRRPEGPTERVPIERSASEPAPVALVAALRYDPQQPPSVVEISAADAAEILLQNTVSAHRSPGEAFAAATAVARQAKAISGTRSEAAAAARDLLDRLSI